MESMPCMRQALRMPQLTQIHARPDVSAWHHRPCWQGVGCPGGSPGGPHLEQQGALPACGVKLLCHSVARPADLDCKHAQQQRRSMGPLVRWHGLLVFWVCTMHRAYKAHTSFLPAVCPSCSPDLAPTACARSWPDAWEYPHKYSTEHDQHGPTAVGPCKSCALKSAPRPSSAYCHCHLLSHGMAGTTCLALLGALHAAASHLSS